MEALLSPLVLCNKAKGRISLAVIAYWDLSGELYH